MKDITNDEINETLYSSRSLEFLKHFEKKKAISLGIPKIDADFGFPTGYYIIVGDQGIGKSWFALWIARTFHINGGVNSVLFSLEMPEYLVRKRLLQQWSNLTRSELESGGDTTPATDLMGRDAIVVNEFYGEDTSKRTPENFKNWVDTYYLLGFRVFLMDHFHELGGASSNDTNQGVVEKWGSVFQQLCKKYPDIWLFIFAQPSSKDFDKKILNRNSLRGSKAIIDKCDYVMSLNKNIEVTETEVIVKEDNIVLLYLDKTRYTQTSNIAWRMTFHPTGNFGSAV